MSQTQRQGSLPAASLMPGLHAGFWMRVGAYLLDGVILSIAAVILYCLLVLPVGFDSRGWPEHSWPVVVFYLVLIPSQWLYFALFESSRHQATPGKMVLGIVVTDGRGERIGFGRASGRYFAKILSGMIFYVGFMMAGWTARKQALHDLIADTFVLRRQGLEDLQASEDFVPDSSATQTFPAWAIALIAVGSVSAVIFLTAIFSAIAIPLYLNYTQQAQIGEAIALARHTSTRLVQYHARKGTWPPPEGVARFNRYAASHAPVGKYASKLQVVDCQGETCGIVATLRSNGVDRRIAGRTLELWTVDGGRTWYCGPGGTNPLDERNLPPSCRDADGGR